MIDTVVIALLAIYCLFVLGAVLYDIYRG